MLTKVKNFWVKGVLEKSLYNQVLIELGLENRPDAVANPWNVILETGEDSTQPLPEGTKVIDIFDQIGAGRTLLILGEPGSGKTTTLLELTRDLIARAEQDIDLLIPIIFNLSSWANKRQKIADWLVEELNTKYDVPTKIGQAWVTQQQLLPLLDGLDEVKAEYRDDCIDTLNQFKQEYGAELVVCSRIKDYEDLSNRLNFQSAVYIRLLSPEQIFHYLDIVGVDLTGLRALIVEDTVLQWLAQSPLMLNIMTLTYQGVAVEDLPKTELVEERRNQLFDDYIEKMFHRSNRSKGDLRYSESQTKRWLTWLAKRMAQESQMVFLIERMQPTLLENRTQKYIYSLIGLLDGGLISRRKRDKIKMVEKVNIKLTKILIVTMITGLSIVLIFVLILGIEWVSVGLIFGLILGPILGMSLGLETLEIQTKTSPNQGIWKSVRNAITLGLTFGLIAWLIVGLPLGLIVGLTFGLIRGLNFGLMMGVAAGLQFGGIACIQHFTLRLILYCNNNIPWNYARFLDYAAERIFLQKVGGGYIFIHRMLMEHFAQMELESISRR